jgi:hypothetical protein
LYTKSFLASKLTTETKEKISKLYLASLRLNNTSNKIIRLLFEKNKTRKEILELEPNTDTYSPISYSLYYLKSRGLVFKTKNNWGLTQFGKFGYLMCMYRINFIQLCFLLETFDCQQRMIKYGCSEGFYSILDFVDKVEDAFTTEYVRWSVSQLTRKKLLYRHHKHAFAVVPQIFEELVTKHLEIVQTFHSWFYGAWEKKRTLILHDQYVNQRQNDSVEFYLKLAHGIVFSMSHK